MIIPHHDKSRKRKKKNLTKKLSILNAYINFRLTKVSNSRYGQALYFASQELRADRECVKAAVENKGIIIKYASKELQEDKEIAMIAVKQDKKAFYFISENLQKDEDIKALT